MWIRKKEEEVAALHQEALALLEQGELDRAEAHGRTLETLGWTGAYEVLALVARERGDLAGAIAVLTRGTTLAPDAWQLHQLHGNLLDLAGRTNDALTSYDTALGCPSPWHASVRFNRAITRLRAGDAGGALADAEFVLTEGGNAPFVGESVRVAVDALFALGRTEDAVALVDHMIGLAKASSEGSETSSAAPLYATKARALMARGADEAEVRAALEAAIEGGAGNVEAAALLGALEATHWAPEPLRRFRLVLEVEERTADATGYLRIYSVVAANADAARVLALRLEPSRVREAATVNDLVDEGPAEGPPSIRPSGRIHFRE